MSDKKWEITHIVIRLREDDWISVLYFRREVGTEGPFFCGESPQEFSIEEVLKTKNVYSLTIPRAVVLASQSVWMDGEGAIYIVLSRYPENLSHRKKIPLATVDSSGRVAELPADADSCEAA